MSWKRSLAGKWTWMSVIWLAMTLSLVGWWWVHALESSAFDPRIQRMFLWEGIFLLAALSVGGIGLVYLTFHHQARHERLKTFFSTFAHDLKTSMTRLRLQADLLEESNVGKDPTLLKILKDIQRLDLQLENSLWMAQIDSGALLMQRTRLREVMDRLRNEFGEIRLDMNRDAEIDVDRRAFTIVLRNLFHNSLLHGKADRIEIQVQERESGTIILEIGDNGGGLRVPTDRLGREVLSSRGAHSNGLGLFLSRRLVERMNGRLEFRGQEKFINVVTLQGRSV